MLYPFRPAPAGDFAWPAPTHSCSASGPSVTVLRGRIGSPDDFRWCPGFAQDSPGELCVRAKLLSFSFRGRTKFLNLKVYVR